VSPLGSAPTAILLNTVQCPGSARWRAAALNSRPAQGNCNTDARERRRVRGIKRESRGGMVCVCDSVCV
jgi:hypothetical protein